MRSKHPPDNRTASDLNEQVSARGADQVCVRVCVCVCACVGAGTEGGREGGGRGGGGGDTGVVVFVDKQRLDHDKDFVHIAVGKSFHSSVATLLCTCSAK
jgi:hypothetical protein